jgi:iron complex outermembrane receptor protein
VGLDGEGAPASSSLHVDESTELHDERSFAGLYGQAEWQLSERWNLEGGLRVNHTRETREGELVPGDGGEGEEGEEEEAGVEDEKSFTRTSGVLGINGLVWDNGRDGVWVFADYRNSFKPAALDFGPEVEGSEILDPETSHSVEVGVKGNVDGNRLRWQASAFDMHMSNLVVSVTRNDLPALENGGKQRFRGFELEGTWRIVESLEWQGAYAWHDPKFEDYTQEFDGVPTQLEGNRPELAPKRLWGTGLSWAPADGFNAHARVEWVGDRYLNRRNTVLAPSYTTYAAGVGYRFARWEARLDGDNLTDERPPVSESELGEAQFYRLPARTFRLSAGVRF